MLFYHNSFIFRMKRSSMNTYIYAPKDDVKHRALWRQLYTKAEECKLVIMELNVILLMCKGGFPFRLKTRVLKIGDSFLLFFMRSKKKVETISIKFAENG